MSFKYGQILYTQSRIFSASIRGAVTDLGNIEPARSNIRGHQHFLALALEPPRRSALCQPTWYAAANLTGEEENIEIRARNPSPPSFPENLADWGPVDKRRKSHVVQDWRGEGEEGVTEVILLPRENALLLQLTVKTSEILSGSRRRTGSRRRGAGAG